MDHSQFFHLSPFRKEISFNKYNSHTHQHLPLLLHYNSYTSYFSGPRHTPISIDDAAAVKLQRRNKVKKRQVSIVANAYADQNQCTQTDLQKHKQSNVFLSNDMIRGYARNGFCEEALRMYYQMQRTGIKPDRLVFISLVNACGSLSDLQAGRKIHEDIIARGFESDVFVATALASMYIKCGSLGNARQVFDGMPERDVVSWNAVIAGCSQSGNYQEALSFFNEMLVQGNKPNSSTLVSILPVCAQLLALEQGKQIHGYVITSGDRYSVMVGNALVDMYAKCRSVDTACKLFERMPEKNVVSWNSIMAGYSFNGHSHEALAFFNKMQIQGIKANSITVISVLPACAQLLALAQGKQIHSYVIRNGLDYDVVVGNALVDMYTKCGHINTAYKSFERMPQRNVSSWNTIIDGYAQNDHPREALAFFNEMQVCGVKSDSITMVIVLSVCAELLVLEQGKQIHAYVIRSGFQFNVFVGNGLVNMYAKCGRISVARQVFDKMSNRDVGSWNAMILGYGIHGQGEDAVALFSQMQQTGTKPDHITFIGVLTACSHAGLVDKGLQCFEGMKSNYGLAPQLEHYVCLVDLLGRAGHLDEAHDIIKNMPLEPNAGVWGALLGACRIHCNIELGEQAAKQIFELEPNNSGCYVLLSNIYAEVGRWEDVANLRKMMRDREVKKQPGCSFIEINRETHTFHMGGRAHPQSENIYATLEALYGQIKEAGYVPKTNLVLQDVEEELKENMLSSHSEKLAIAFGIINTSLGNPIHIMKNLRVCSDCHNATKFISKIVGREIIVRDSNRFHHFKNGLCSCGDYW